MKLTPTCQQANSLVEDEEASRAGGPLVSLIVVCYNQAPYLEECLESVKRQTYRNLEIIVIDDCSHDGSVAVIKDWLARNDLKTTLLVHSVNVGVCRTFNEALAHSRGKYISVIAADDVYLPDKFETQVRLFEKLPATVGVVYGDAWQIDEHGDPLPDKFIESHRKFPSMPEGRIFDVLLEGNFIPAMSALIRRSCFQTVGPYDELLIYEDYDMWLRLSRDYEFAFSPVISAKYRVVPNSVTRTVLHQGAGGLTSDFRIFEKCLKAKGLSTVEQKIIKRRLKGLAFEIYARNCRRRRLYMLKLFWHAPDKYSLSMLLFAAAGIPFRYFDALLKRWKAAHPNLNSMTAEPG